MTWEPPGELEEYRIVRALGAGAMGQVFLAHDTLLDRPVAIKFVGAQDVGAAARERFFIEARAVARLAHPNVVTIHRVGEVRRRPFLVSEYVRGTPLAAVARPVPWERAVRIGIGLARGLAAAHRRGVLHRDLKPANVMLGEDDEAKLLDFGLAKLLEDADPRATDGVVAPRELAVKLDGDPEATASIAPSTPRAQVPAASLARVTLAGVVGTPLYMAPELWASAPASVRSDLYALGVVLYELIAGSAPHAGVGVAELAARTREVDAPPLASASDAPAQLCALVDACIAREAARRPESADAVCAALEAALADGPAEAPLEGSPYRGLSTFEAAHRTVFFGRAEEARAVVERLRTETFVVVAGDSGVGKSSLCRAAVVPAIAGVAHGGRRWRAATVIPGVCPLARLDEALAERADGEGLLLFIDQLEELLTVADPDEAEAVAIRIAELAVSASGVRVLASARSDFLGRLAGLPGLGDLIGRALYLLGPIGERGLRDAIAGPARALGYEVAPELVDELVASGRRNLPLLQFTLAELWEARDDATHTIPATALERIGGVAGALGRRADQVMAALGEADREIAWRVFVRLTTGEGTRAVATRGELAEVIGDPEAVERVVERLVGARLLSVADDAERIEVVHEALFTGWPRFVAWRRAHEEGARMRDQHGEAARAWDRRGRPRGLLWRGDALADYRAWRRRWPEPPTGVEAAFAAASEAEARRTRRIRIGLLALTLAGLSAAIVVLYRSDRRAEAERDEAVVQRAEAERQRTEAERQRRQLLVEHGAQELGLGNPARALPYFLEAMKQGEDTPAVRVLVAAAAHPLERRIATLRDMPAGFTGVAWAPDGKSFVATAMDGAVQLYDRAGNVLRRARVDVDPSANWLRDAPPQFSADGGHAGFVTTRRTVHVWNVATGTMRALPNTGVDTFAFTPDGIATLGGDGLRTWTLDGAAVVDTGQRATCFAAGPAGFAIVDANGTIATLDPRGRLTARAPIEKVYLCVVAFTRDGRFIVVGRHGGTTIADVRIYRASDLTQVGEPITDAVFFALSEDGTKVVTEGTDGVRVWETATHALLSQYAQRTASRDSFSAAFDRAGRRLVLWGDGRVHRVIDLVEKRTLWEYEATTTSPTAPHSSARTVAAQFSPDDALLLTATGNELSLQRVDNAPLVAELPEIGTFSARLSPSEETVAVVGYRTIEVWDPARAARLSRFDLAFECALRDAFLIGKRERSPTDENRTCGDLRVWEVSWHPDGRRFVVGGGDGRLEVYAQSGERLRVYEGHDAAKAVNGAVWSPGGERIASASDDGTAKVWDAATGSELASLPHPSRAMAVAWSSDGARLATAGWDGVLRVWHLASGRVETQITDPLLRFLHLAWSPDGTRLAGTTHSGVVGLWEVATGRRILALTGHMGSVTTAAWSPDGALLATSGIDGLTRVWDARTGRELRSFPVHHEALQVTWSRDGSKVVVAGGNVRIWEVRRDRRTLAELEAFVNERVPWRLVDGRLELVR